jgi:hypothetical protein
MKKLLLTLVLLVVSNSCFGSIEIENLHINKLHNSNDLRFYFDVINTTNESVPEFRFQCFLGNPADKINLNGQANDLSNYGVGPIEPKGKWTASTKKFQLADGEHKISIFSNNEILATKTFKIKNGKPVNTLNDAQLSFIGSVFLMPFIPMSILFILMSLPLVYQKIAPNYFYGFRFAPLYKPENKQLWYDVNKYAAIKLIHYSISGLILGMLFSFAVCFRMRISDAAIFAVFILWTTAVFVPIVQSYCYMKKRLNE